MPCNKKSPPWLWKARSDVRILIKHSFFCLQKKAKTTWRKMKLWSGAKGDIPKVLPAEFESAQSRWMVLFWPPSNPCRKPVVTRVLARKAIPFNGREKLKAEGRVEPRRHWQMSPPFRIVTNFCLWSCYCNRRRSIYHTEGQKGVGRWG